MKRLISDVHFGEELRETIKNDIFFKGFKFWTIKSYLFSIIWLLIVEHEKRYSRAVKSCWSSHSISIVSESRRHIEKNNMIEVREIKSPACNLCTDHNSILFLPELKISVSSVLLIKISMNFKHSSILYFVFSRFSIGIFESKIVQ